MLFIIKVFFVININAENETNRFSIKLHIFIKDSLTQKPIPDVTVSLPELQINKQTDANGKVTIKTTKGDFIIITQHISYGYHYHSTVISQDTTLTLYIAPISYNRNEFVVTARREKAIEGLSGGNITLNIQRLQNLPQFLGSCDPLKILQLTPGVQTAGTGNSGLFVRGGESGQNLVLFNDAPVYQPSHLLGFFSIFNTGHISYLQLQKNGMESQYGGRLSSVLLVKSPDTIPEKISISGNIGILASQATLSIPLGNKYALYVSARKTYMNLILNPLLSGLGAISDDGESFNYDFQDYNLSFIARPSKKDIITLHSYFGADKFKLEQDEYQLTGKMNWNNLAASLQWKHNWNIDKSFRQVIFTGRYQNNLENDQTGFDIELPSLISTLGYKNEFTFKSGPVKYSSGIEYNYYYLEPQTPLLKINQNLYDNLAYQKYKNHSLAFFAESNWQMTSKLSARLGLRYTYYLQTGPYDNVLYNEYDDVISSTHFSKGTKVYDNHYIEPRVELKYRFSENNSAHISYNRHNQFINLVSISSVGLPTDFWVPASRNIPSQHSDNFSAGYYHSIYENDYEISVEGYYRQMSNQMELKSELFDLMSQKFILEKSIAYGKGNAYGGEIMLKKNTGKITGWISYALSWSYRKFPEINNGKKFPAKHDRRHDLSFTLVYSPNRKWDFSSVFVYATGNAFTLPIGMYIMGGLPIKEYGEYNSFRLPDYHRIDLSATYWFFKKKERESGFNISLYNAYNRSNPLYLYFGVKESDLENNYLKIRRKQSALYKIVPSISWMFKF